MEPEKQLEPSDIVKEKQSAAAPAPGLSPMAKELTYGERQYNFIFGYMINFWVNLLTSAVFTYWVTHSQKSFKLLGKEFSAPSVLQQKLASKFYTFAPMGVFGAKETYDPASPPSTMRGKAASNAANVFTLVMAGHPIMIGSVWLGAKVKAPIVKYFNRRHYGDEAMENPDIKARHLAIEAEERPTLFGAVIGRLGTIAATQFTAYTVGNGSNLFSWMGKRIGFNFPGMDRVAEIGGNHLGMAAQDLMPSASNRLDNFLAKDGKYNWSARQIQENAALRNTPYHNSFQHVGKYLAQDVLYSAVTAGSIGPAMNFMKKYIPGMTYRPKLSPERIAEGKILERALHIKPNPLADIADNGVSVVDDYGLIKGQPAAADHHNDNDKAVNDNEFMTKEEHPKNRVSAVALHQKSAAQQASQGMTNSK